MICYIAFSGLSSLRSKQIKFEQYKGAKRIHLVSGKIVPAKLFGFCPIPAFKAVKTAPFLSALFSIWAKPQILWIASI